MWAEGGIGSRRPVRIMSVIGTRPEVIKMAPVVFAARGAGVEHRLVATGQHESLFAQALDQFGLTVDDRLHVGASGGDVAAQADRVRQALAPLLLAERPDMVLVQGDTTSAYAAALCARDCGIPVGHVEAGLRSGDLSQPWPEEGNRIAIDAIATLLFPPTEGAAANLAREPAVTGAVHVTGNTGIDALLWMRQHVRSGPRSAPDRRVIAVTCHRRENHGHAFLGICDALRQLADRPDVEIIFPLHPNPAVRSDAERHLGGHKCIRLLPPLGYAEMVELLDQAHLLLTDSGGLQEEAPALGLPTLVLRNVTERPEALKTGNLKLVGTDFASIVGEASSLLDDPRRHARMSRAAFPYGNGRAAIRIIAHAVTHLAAAHSG